MVSFVDRGETFGVELPVACSVEELALAHGGEVDEGVSNRIVRRVVSPEHAARDDDLVLVTSARRTAEASTRPGVLLCHASIAARCPVGHRWVHEHALYVVARLLSPIAEREAPSAVARSAIVHPGAVVHESAIVGAGAVVQSGAIVGKGTVIGENAVVHGRVRLGERVTVGPLAVIGRPGFGWAFGPSGDVLRVPQLGGVVVEDDAEIGALCTIDAGTLGPTRVGRGAKLDAHVHVAHNVVIGPHTLVAAQAGFAGSATIGAGVLVGGQAGVTDHAQIGAGARIGAKSGVIGDVAPGVAVAGFPAIPRMDWLRAWARLLGSSKRSIR
jgi:UDP-3-O-[3-hydroxymyristoyl] glucosamine N-acyltransferase